MEYSGTRMIGGPRWFRAGRASLTRRGIATFWLLLFVPVFLVLLGVMVNVANLWLARVELATAVESAALAAVTEWVENPSGGTSGAVLAGQAYANANTVRGQSVSLPTGAFLFGSVYQNLSGQVVFDATTSPDCTAAVPKHPGVLVQTAVPVGPLWSNLLGHLLPAGQVKGFAIAEYPCGADQPRLIWADTLILP